MSGNKSIFRSPLIRLRNSESSSVTQRTESSATVAVASESNNEKLLRALIEKKNKKKNKNKKAFSNSEEEAVDTIVQKTFDSVIGKDAYTPLKTSDWMSKMIQKISKVLEKREDSRKFVIHCTICSRTDELSICSANMCFWDTEKDVAVYSEWTSKTVFGAVHVFFITHRFS